MPSNTEPNDEERVSADDRVDGARAGSPDQRQPTRRRLLATGAGILAGLAGCSDQRTTPVRSPSESPAVSPETPTDVPTEPAPTPTLSGRWPTAYADSANTGVVDADGPRGTPSVRWEKHVDLETGMWVSDGPDAPVAVREDGLVVAYDDGGATRWRKDHPGTFTAAPVVADDGTVVVGSRDGTVTAYDADGTRRWRRTTSEGVYAPHANDATPFRIADDLVVLVHPHGTAMAFDLSDGARQWSVDVPPRAHRPAVENGRVYLVGNGEDRRRSIVQARALSDGSELWSESTDRPVGIGPGVEDGVVYVGGLEGLLVARDATDGSEQWRVRLPDDPWISTLPVVFGETVWVGTLSNGLFAVSGGSIQSHVEIGTSTSPVVGDGRLYIGSTDFGGTRGANGTVAAIDADGTELWRTGVRGQPNAILGYRDGRVVVGTETGVVDALDAAVGQRVWRAYERAAGVPSPVVGDGAVYCGSARNWVNGFRASDGTSHLWGEGFDGPAPATPVVAGETVISGSHSGDVAGTPVHEYADPPGDRLTQTPTAGPSETDIHIDAPLPEARWRISLDGPVGDFGYGDAGAYVGSGETVVALTATGDVRWEADVGERVREAPAAVDGTVYATTTAGTLFALAAADGEEGWRRSVGETATAPVVTDVDGTPAVVVGTDAAVVAVAAKSGDERWRTETAHVRGSPAVTSGRVIAGDEAGLLRGLALRDGEERWHVETDGAIHGAPAVGGGHAYVGSRDRRVYAVAVDDGSVAWNVELQDWVDGSPAIGYGALFVVDQSGTLTAVHGGR